jgi:hypothetical protein
VRTVLVTIVGPAGTAGLDASVRDGPPPRRDLSLPADVPLAELLPTLVRLFGGPGARTAGYWTLASADGSTLRADVPLGANGILNGALLQLQHVQSRAAVVVELPVEPPAPIQWDQPVEPALVPSRVEPPAAAPLAAGRPAVAWPPPAPVPAFPAGREPEPPEPAGNGLDELEPVVPIGSRRWREEFSPVPDDPGQGNGLPGGGVTDVDLANGGLANGGLANGGLANGAMANGAAANGIASNGATANGVPPNGAPVAPDRDAAPPGGWRPAARVWDARRGAWREEGGRAPGPGGAGHASGAVNGHLDGAVDGTHAGMQARAGVAVRSPAPAVEGALARARRALRSTDSPRHLDAGIVAPRLRRGITVAVVSPKPGSGRTTVTALLAATLVELRPDQVRVIAGGGGPARAAPRHHAPFGGLDQLDGEPGRAAGAVALGGVVLLDCVAGLDGSTARGAIGHADQLVVVTDADPATGSLVVEAALPLLEAGRSVTLVVNQRPVRGRRLDVRRLQQMLPMAGGPVLLPYEPAAGAALDGGRLALGDAPAAWRRAGRELAFILTADWRARGCAR